MVVRLWSSGDMLGMVLLEAVRLGRDGVGLVMSWCHTPPLLCQAAFS